MCAQAGQGRPPVIFLMGPTAAGKTDLAVELVKRLPCDIISVDSAMVYRGLDIGTAKPEAALLARAPHRLIDIRDPADAYSAAQFARDAQQHINAIHAACRIPLLVGGTLLYFRALAQGLSPLPDADSEVRARLLEQAEVQGWPALHAQLARQDPVSARKIHPNDSQRIQRALEILALSGRSRSESFVRRAAPAEQWRLCRLIVAPGERSLLHARIEKRFSLMLEKGFVAEVEKLFNRPDLHESLPAIRAVGYRQLWLYFKGEWSLDEAGNRAVIATRQLARRQLTWLRAERAQAWIDSLDVKRFDIAQKALQNAFGRIMP